LIDALLGTLLDELGITSPLRVPPGIEVTRREGDGRSYLFILNHNADPTQVPLAVPMYDLLSGETRTAMLELPAKGVAVLVMPSL
jgi:beta-galactosidase